MGMTLYTAQGVECTLKIGKYLNRQTSLKLINKETGKMETELTYMMLKPGNKLKPGEVLIKNDSIHWGTLQGLVKAGVVSESKRKEKIKGLTYKLDVCDLLVE